MAKAKKIGRVPKKPSVAAAEPKRPMPKWRIVFASCFALLSLILLVYAYSMTSQYVFNDYVNLGSVNSLQDRSKFWLDLLMSGFGAPLSLPWLKATYAWDTTSFGYAPGWSHAVNICLHICSCIYFYLFTFRLAWRSNLEQNANVNPYYFSAGAAGLLALHPLITGSVAYVSGREGVLGAVNYFLALNCFLYGFYEERLGRALLGYLSFIIFSAIGILANGQCLTLPFLAAGLILLLRPEGTRAKDWLAERSYEIISLVCLGLFASYFLTLPTPPKIDSSFGFVPVLPTIYWATQFKMIFMYYLRCVLIPFGLSVYPSYVAQSGFVDLGTLAGVISLIAIAVAGGVQKLSLTRIGTLLFALTLCPWIFLAHGELSADSRFYLPLSGLCMIAGVVLARFAVKKFKVTAIVFGVILVSLATLTVWREVHWSSDKRLWKSEIRSNPNNARAHAYLAAYLLENSKLDQAKHELAKALTLQKDDLIAHVVNGYYLYRVKDFKQSAAELQTALVLADKCNINEEQRALYRAQLAKALSRINDTAGAYKQADLASRFITTDPFLYLLNGKSLLERHEPLKALKSLEDGFKLEPTNADFLVPIAQASLDSGVPQVLQHGYAAAAKATQVRPSMKASKLYIRACLELGRPEEAQARLKSFEKTDPNDAELWWLGYGYAKLAGKAQEAEVLRKKALSMEPGIDKRVKLYLRNASQLVIPNSVKFEKDDGGTGMDTNKLKSVQTKVLSAEPETVVNSEAKPTAPEPEKKPTAVPSPKP